MKKQTLAIIILVLALVGVAVSTYSFLHNRNFASGEFCTIGETFDCDIVNKGPYSTIMGFPVSMIGIIGYAFLVLASVLKLRDKEDHGLSLFLVLASGAALLFSLYLSSLEAFVLKAWCLICLVSQFLILFIFASSVWLMRKDRISDLDVHSDSRPIPPTS